MKRNDIVLLVNIVTLYALYRLGVGSAFSVLSARIFLSAITFGSMSALPFRLICEEFLRNSC